MISFEIDGVEFTAEIITEEDFERDFYDDAIGAGAAFTGPDGKRYVILSPKPTV